MYKHLCPNCGNGHKYVLVDRDWVEFQPKLDTCDCQLTEEQEDTIAQAAFRSPPMLVGSVL